MFYVYTIDSIECDGNSLYSIYIYNLISVILSVIQDIELY